MPFFLVLFVPTTQAELDSIVIGEMPPLPANEGYFVLKLELAAYLESRQIRGAEQRKIDRLGVTLWHPQIKRKVKSQNFPLTDR